ncbi:uncharacterized protein LOC122397674 [Colletes gigas]|uniref:uncharacterized protein LOC122397674 n=1 Tax=Colletes gigas TaxID=935657 RepID=UPI001C9A860C|nr:uncharacterized protein LOC122397674 [Colletes gigas]
MNVIAKTILNSRYDHAKTLVLRLCKKRNRMSYINNARRRTFVTFYKISEDYKYSFLYRKYAQVAISNNEEVIQSKEHVAMFKILQDSEHYRHTIMWPIKTTLNISIEERRTLQNTDWSSETAFDLLEAFKKFTHCHLQNFRFDEETYNTFLGAFAKKLYKLDEKQIQILMQHMIISNDSFKYLDNYQMFIKALSSECLKKFFGADVTQLLYVISGFFQIEAFKCDYMWRALRKLGSKTHYFSGKNMVLFLLYLTMCKVPNINMYDIEYWLNECIDDLSPDEIGIIARGFFLQQKKFNIQPIIKSIVTKLKNNIDNVNNVTLASIMKSLRYCGYCCCLDTFQELLVVLRPKIAKYPLMTLTHIAHTCGGLRVYDKILLNNICERLLNEISYARIKDMERITYALCTLAPYTELHEELHKVLDELLLTYKTRREKEIQKYPSAFLRILTFLSMKNIYSTELIEHALNPAIVNCIYSNNVKLLTNDLLIMECSTKIEVPNYTGPFLKDKIYQCLIKKYCSKNDVTDRHSMVTLRTEIIFICKEILGLNIYTDNVLPHYYSNVDIIFGFDEHKNSVPVEHILSAMPYGSIKRVDDDNLSKIQWKILYLLSDRTKVRGRDGYIGPCYQQLRQLKTIGYTPIPLCEFMWKNLTENEKHNYLREIILHDNDSNIMEKRML